jgi:AAA domain
MSRLRPAPASRPRRPGRQTSHRRGRQVGTADLALIQQAAGPAGALAVGDPAQLGPVEAGGWFTWFATELGATELSEVRRFTSGWEADASLQLRHGDKTALAAYDAHGRIRAGDREAMHDKAALAFLADYLDGKDSILLAGSNAEAADLARRVQDKLIRAGRVQRPQFDLADDNQAGVGDLVRARENAKTIDAAGQPLANRDVLRIQARVHGQVQVRRQVQGGWSDPFLLPERYLADHGELAYAGNTHVAQGRTTDTAHLLVTGSLNRRSLYVGMTRGRQANTAYVATGEPVPGKEPELLHPEAVLAEIIDNDATELTATEAIRQAQERSASTGHLANIWAAAMRGIVEETIDSKLKERLAASDYQRYLREPQRQPLHHALTERELNGENVNTLIDRISSADLTGAGGISAVLHERLARIDKPEDAPSSWAQRTPENAPQLAHEAAKAIDDRITALGMRCAEKPEPWLTSQLGAFLAHGSALEQQDYLHRAGSAAAYREAAGIDDPQQAASLIPHKGDSVRERMRRDTITQLEIRDVEQLYQAMSRGELEAKEQHARRAYAAAPRNVSAELKDTAQAEADQRQAAVEAEAQDDQPTAKALHSLADLLGTRKTALEADHAKHENWSAQTAGRREQGGRARAELTRRGQTPEARPGETTLEWWQRFERDCQAFEQHLVSLEAQAETEGRPWPPQDGTGGTGDDLQVHPVPLVLSRVEGPVRGDPVDGNQRPVQDHIGVPGLLRVPDRLAQLRRPGSEQFHGLIHIAPGRGGADREPGCEVGECLALAQVGQDQKCLLPGVQLPPARPDRRAIAADEAGHESQGPGRQRQRGTVKQHQSPWWCEAFLVDRLTYQGLLCLSGDAPPGDHPVTDGPDQAESGWKTLTSSGARCERICR